MDLNPIVKYDNWMNDLEFNDFTSVDFNLFFLLCSILRDKGTERIHITFDEIKNAIHYKKNSNKALMEDLVRMNKKLMKVNCTLELHNEINTIVQFTVFNYFELSEASKTVTVEISPRFEFVLNNLLKQYTMFDLRTFLVLKSKYSKTLFRLFKQWNGRLRFECSLEKLRLLLDIPEKYEVRDITKYIIKPAIEEIQKTGTFLHLTYKVKKSRKQGHPTTSYIFTWATKDGTKIKNIENYTEKELDELFSLPSDLRDIAEIVPDDQLPTSYSPYKAEDIDLTPFLQDEADNVIPPENEPVSSNKKEGPDFMDMADVKLTEADKQMILNFLRDPHGANNKA